MGIVISADNLEAYNKEQEKIYGPTLYKCHKCGKEHLEYMDYVPDYSTGKLVEWCSKCWKQHYVDEDNARTQKLITMTRNFNESLKKQGLI